MNITRFATDYNSFPTNAMAGDVLLQLPAPEFQMLQNVCAHYCIVESRGPSIEVAREIRDYGQEAKPRQAWSPQEIVDQVEALRRARKDVERCHRNYINPYDGPESARTAAESLFDIALKKLADLREVLELGKGEHS
jgi:hypothetical protein